MDILTHTLSGIAVGTILVNFTRNGYFEKIPIVLFSGLGAAFPDIDAISLWSKFDGTFGKFFGLAHTGREIYSSKLWYSHHAFFHSLSAGFLFALLIMAGLYLVRLYLGTDKSLWSFIRKHIFVLVAFLAGDLMHLLGDMPTPSAVWGGVNLFWPLHVYIGGTGKIWWWNNYDIFLFVSSCIVLNTIIYISGGFFAINRKLISVLVGAFCFILIEIQINTRTIDFNYTGSTAKYEFMEAQSKQYQKNFLGDRLYRLMEKLDNKLFIYF
jgi:hypothetical protein